MPRAALDGSTKKRVDAEAGAVKAPTRCTVPAEAPAKRACSAGMSPETVGHTAYIAVRRGRSGPPTTSGLFMHEGVTRAIRCGDGLGTRSARRSLLNLLDTLGELEAARVALVVHAQAIDTGTPAKRMVLPDPWRICRRAGDDPQSREGGDDRRTAAIQASTPSLIEPVAGLHRHRERCDARHVGAVWARSTARLVGDQHRIAQQDMSPRR